MKNTILSIFVAYLLRFGSILCIILSIGLNVYKIYLLNILTSGFLMVEISIFTMDSSYYLIVLD